MIGAMEVRTLQEWLAEGRPMRLLDVREEAEWQIAHLPGAELRPLSRLASWLEEVVGAEDSRPIVVYCHHGMRSARVCASLLAHGIREVHNLAGGIERWAVEIDPQMNRY